MVWTYVRTLVFILPSIILGTLFLASMYCLFGRDGAREFLAAFFGDEEDWISE